MFRRNIGILLLVSFVAIAVLGFLGMGGHRACIAATFEGVPECTNSGSEFGEALFHISAFKAFSQAVRISAVAGLLLSVVALAVVWFAQTRLLDLAAHRRSTHRLEQIRLRIPQQVQRWLILHEKRDPSSGFVGA